jgi:hypothetical protein
MVGIKTGLVITHSELVDLLDRALAKPDVPDWYYSPEHWLQAPTDARVRLAPDELESLVVRVMYLIGALPDALTSHQVVHRFAIENPSYVEKLPPTADEDDFPLPVPPWVRFQWFFADLATSGQMPEELQSLFDDYQRRSIFKLFFEPPTQWDGKASLVELFHLRDLSGAALADLSTPPLIDQLFIDYLQAQPEDLARMDWRQFEYLVGEWFRRCGYRVTVTPPGNDGGVDLRAVKDVHWPGPELVLVQAKRFGPSRQVDIESVKALWTDVDEESATRGIIATTSILAKGARAFCEARHYRLTAAERTTVDAWLKELARYPR